MKTLASIGLLHTVAVLILTSVIAAPAHADQMQEDCSKGVAQAVRERATKDFPGEDLTALKPNMDGWDGGEVLGITVDVVKKDQPAQIVAVYIATIDETCAVYNIFRDR